MTSVDRSAGGRNRLLAGLPPADFSLLASDLKDFPLRLGTLLQEAGSPIDWVYFPNEGMISLLAVMKNGGAVETATVGREGAVGAMSGLGSLTASSRAVVQLVGKASRLRPSQLAAAAGRSAAIRALLVRYNDALMAMVHQSVGCNALHSAEARLSRWLLQTLDRGDGQSEIVSLTHEFLSQMLGVRRTTVTLVARQLHERDLISYGRGRIRILTRSGLEDCACECYELTRQRTAAVFAADEA